MDALSAATPDILTDAEKAALRDGSRAARWPNPAAWLNPAKRLRPANWLNRRMGLGLAAVLLIFAAGFVAYAYLGHRGTNASASRTVQAPAAPPPLPVAAPAPPRDNLENIPLPARRPPQLQNQPAVLGSQPIVGQGGQSGGEGCTALGWSCDIVKEQ